MEVQPLPSRKRKLSDASHESLNASCAQASAAPAAVSDDALAALLDGDGSAPQRRQARVPSPPPPSVREAAFVNNTARRTLHDFFRKPAVQRRAGSLLSANAATGTAYRMEEMLPSAWRKELSQHFSTPSWRSLCAFVRAERASSKRIYPPERLTFHAFQRCHFDDVKVVIIGQDPYHNEGQAHGLCFSVPRGVPPPPSLVNIFTELAAEYPADGGSDNSSVPEAFRVPPHGCLEAWADQGVLLLNAVLTVEAHKAGSHAKQGGWQKFTDEVIRVLDERKRAEHGGIVFMLWGNYAKEKGAKVNSQRHLVLRAAHPSPMSATRGGWFGCNHFRMANDYLKAHGRQPIRWNALTEPAAAPHADAHF
ncbi:hypothetical protein CDCA_CDCA01G0112 [Cyanidium caldarium]|uniref:Uracil-DNA glycosylase n=1 Tax=Cyanidium caldarium TaxID=2771 RepID=A0AAV9IP07_CYACA|nr:hypothetical protein CDCA_CDCA01G0112 [Cyanidium caldarium]